jgi:hypothetical protein
LYIIIEQIKTIVMILKPSHEIFIKELIAHGDKVRAYRAAYPGTTDESARVGATKLLKNEEIQQKLSNVNTQIYLGLQNDKQAFIFQEAKVLNVQRQYLLNVLAQTTFVTIKEKLMAIQLDRQLAEQQMALLGYGSLKQAKNEYLYDGFGHTYQQLSAQQAVAADAEAVQEKAGLSDNTSPLQGDLGVEITNPETVTFRNLRQEQEGAEQADNTLDNNALAEAVAYNPHPAPVTSEGNGVTYIPLGLKQSSGVKQPSIIKRAKQHKPATVFNNARPGKRRA